MINYTNKINERSVASSISLESHQIGITGTATYTTGQIRLVEVPQGPGPAVTIPGYAEITFGSPTGTNFIVNYTTGVVTFDTTQNGIDILVSYIGLGSEIAAEDINELQNPLSDIVAQTVIWMSPFTTPPSVSWALAPTIAVTSINTLTDTVTLAAGANITLTPSGNTITIASPTATISLTSSHILVGNVSNVATDVALSGDVSITNAGVSTVVSVGGSSASNIHTSQLATANATALDTINTLVLRDGSGNFAAGVITASLTGIASGNLALTGGTVSGSVGIGEVPDASAILDLGSTTQGFLLPRMTSTQRIAISSPATGLVVYDTTNNQWMGYNGTSWVILG